MISEIFQLPSPLEEISFTPFREKGIRLMMKRDDLIHPQISGNKWRKLKWNLEHAKSRGFQSILTFGGAHSNHIAATAAASRIFGIKSIGIIRGEDADLKNPTLSTARENAMDVVPVSRTEFRRHSDYTYLEELKARFGNFYAIPQGGANLLGIQGCMEILKELPTLPDRIYLACGTGTTAAGMLAAGTDVRIFGVSALKGGEFLRKEVNNHISGLYQDLETELALMKNFELETNFHFGGYARMNARLLDFMRNFFSETGIKLDPVYSAKAAYAMTNACKKHPAGTGETWVLIHTGGLQGIEAMETVLGEKIYGNC